MVDEEVPSGDETPDDSAQDPSAVPGSARTEGEDEEVPPEYVCTVCNRVLNHRDSAEGRTYEHTVWDARTADHQPQPVRRDMNPETIERCDFCHDDNPAWRVPVRAFTALPGNISNPDWLACDTCAEIINRGRWNELLRRACSTWEERHHLDMPDSMTTSLMALYRKVRKNVTGAPKPNR